jgi:hypothetical protein
MNLEEFEHQTRETLARALDQLHTATLLVSALERQILESGNTVKDLSLAIENYVTSQAETASPPKG